jgi:hypothetical protein
VQAINDETQMMLGTRRFPRVQRLIFRRSQRSRPKSGGGAQAGDGGDRRRRGDRRQTTSYVSPGPMISACIQLGEQKKLPLEIRRPLNSDYIIRHK